MNGQVVIGIKANQVTKVLKYFRHASEVTIFLFASKVFQFACTHVPGHFRNIGKQNSDELAVLGNTLNKLFLINKLHSS